jgi:hypothetical protein
MRIVVAVLAAVVLSGCTVAATLQGTMFRSAVKVEQHVEERSFQPEVPLKLLPERDKSEQQPASTVVLVRDSDQVKIGDVCYASQRVMLEGKYRDVLYPVVCRR